MTKRKSIIVIVVVALLVTAAWLGRGWLWRKFRELHGGRSHHSDSP